MLTLLVLAATGVLLVLYLAIALSPAVPFNPFPPPTPSPLPSPSPTPTQGSSRPTMAPTQSPFLSPTPLRPATPTSVPEPAMPFSTTVEQGLCLPLLDCTEPLLAGTVTDREGGALVGYPIHVWGPETDTIVVSGSAPVHGPSGWQVTAAGGEEGEGGVWYVQLHLYDVYQVHPPLSEIVRVELPPTCPQAMILFRERR